MTTTIFIPDEYQKAVIDWREGEAVVAAAAGSGKSTVLVERTAWLIREGADPSRILCLMYNKDAAETFRTKLTASVGGYIAERVGVYTFHAWGLALLRTWYPKAQMLGDVLGAPGGKLRSPAKVVYTAMDKAQVSFWEKDWQAWHEMADFVRDRDFDWKTVAEQEALLAIAEDRWSFTDTQQQELLRFLEEFEQLKREGAYCSVDFADMTFFPCRAIRQWETAGRPVDHVDALSRTYQHVQVDEAQDTNPARWRIALHLAKHAKSLVVVGDLRQSLYSWQGAEPDEMLRRIEEGATLLTIPVNRRSTAAIVEHGNAICRGHEWHLGGDALPLVVNGQGQAVRVVLDEEAPTEREEARLVVDEIERRMRQGYQPSAFVILSRTNRGLVPFELQMLVRELPCRVLGRAGGVWGSVVGQEVLAYLRLASGDLRGDIVEVMNKPLRFCTKKDAIAWVQAARLSGEGLRTRIPQPSGPGVERLVADLRMAETFGWKDRCDIVLRWLVSNWDEVQAKESRAKKRKGEPAKPFEDVAEGSSDIDDVETLYRMLHEVAVVAGSVAEIERQIRTANRESPEAVLLSTVHKFKGQERPTAFVTGLRKGMLPHEKSGDWEEERRIFYVASTRAKHELVITTGGAASEFLVEMGLAPDETNLEDGQPGGERPVVS